MDALERLRASLREFEERLIVESIVYSTMYGFLGKESPKYVEKLLRRRPPAEASVDNPKGSPGG